MKAQTPGAEDSQGRAERFAADLNEALGDLRLQANYRFPTSEKGVCSAIDYRFAAHGVRSIAAYNLVAQRLVLTCTQPRYMKLAARKDELLTAVTKRFPVKGLEIREFGY